MSECAGRSVMSRQLSSVFAEGGRLRFCVYSGFFPTVSGGMMLKHFMTDDNTYNQEVAESIGFACRLPWIPLPQHCCAVENMPCRGRNVDVTIHRDGLKRDLRVCCKVPLLFRKAAGDV